MEKNDICYETYIAILKSELVPAMGCTEPIALAYCAAKARAVSGEIPEKVIVEASGNIIKNVKSVIVPNTNGEKGIEAAAGAGIAYLRGCGYEEIAHTSADIRYALLWGIMRICHTGIFSYCAAGIILSHEDFNICRCGFNEECLKGDGFYAKYKG